MTPKAATANMRGRAFNVRDIFISINLPRQFGGEQEGLSTACEDDSPGLGRGPVPVPEYATGRAIN
jgi:hypothetical protein